MVTRRTLGTAIPVLALVIGLGALAALPASAQSDRQVLLVVRAGLSFEGAVDDATLAELASVGGLGLITTSGRAGHPSRTAVNVGAGRSATDAPAGAVPFDDAGGGITVDIAPYVEAAGDATPGLLGSTLADAGLTVGYVDPSASEGRPAMLAAMDRDGHIPAAVLGAGEIPDAILGSALIVAPDPRILPALLDRTQAGEVLVVALGAGASTAMHERGDTVAPIVLARGSPEEILGGGVGPGGLTSETTRRDGVVSDVDVAPTILDFLGVGVPDEMVGAPIEPSGQPPTDLHERYLEFRGVVGPVGMVILWSAITSLLLGLALVFVFRRSHRWLAGVAGLVMLASLAAFVATVPASMLPDFSWAPVIGTLVVVGAAVLALTLRRGRRDARAAVATVAVSGLVAVLLDGLLAWPSQLTPLLGGGVLDGERFFGLGNAHAGIVLAGVVLGAARLPRPNGTALIAAAAVFAGLPFLGADLGGCITLAIAGALWFGIGRWRLGWRTWALAAVAAFVAGILVLLADRVLPGGQTHVSAVTGRALDAFAERLAANADVTSANASAWLAVLGLPVWVVVALRPPERLRRTLEPDEPWSDAVVVLALAGIAGYLLNDTYGLAGSAFAFVSAAMLYPALVSLARSTENTPSSA